VNLPLSRTLAGRTTWQRRTASVAGRITISLKLPCPCRCGQRDRGDTAHTTPTTPLHAHWRPTLPAHTCPHTPAHLPTYHLVPLTAYPAHLPHWRRPLVMQEKAACKPAGATATAHPATLRENSDTRPGGACEYRRSQHQLWWTSQELPGSGAALYGRRQAQKPPDAHCHYLTHHTFTRAWPAATHGAPPPAGAYAHLTHSRGWRGSLFYRRGGALTRLSVAPRAGRTLGTVRENIKKRE